MPRCNAPPDVIRSAMSTAASLLDAQRTPGVIAPGAYADLLAVDGDPLNNIITQLSCCPEQYHRLLTEVVTAASDPLVSPCPSPSSNSSRGCPRPPTETAHSEHVGLPVTVIDRFTLGSAPPVRRSSTHAYLVPGNVNCFPAAGWTVTRLPMSEQVVVVGVDGSPASYTALRWALGHVGRTGGQVRAIRCLRPVAVPAWEAAVTGEPVPASAEQQVWAERELDQIVAAALVRVRDGAQRVAVRRRVVRGSAGPVLVAEAGGAALLVVGSHGHRRFTELAHGSVSAYCIRHASCPVVVIPPASEWGSSWPRWRPGAGRKRVSSRVERWLGWGLGMTRVHPVGRRGQ